MSDTLTATLTANQRRLARLGAPTYAALANGAKAAAGGIHGAQRAMADGADEAPGAMFDVDGDHDGSGAGAGLEHADERHAHDAHDHSHTGAWDDSHLHGGAHLHADGTSHEHDHAHDHGHHDHSSASRAQAGHSHGHVHSHDHGHYYRVTDGRAIDERLVSGEQARTREYVSEVAFQAAGGSAGKGLSAAQYRIAAGVELRLELAAAERAARAQGAFSRNPYGAADIGTPSEAQAAPTDAQIAASATGAVRPLDRDGQPTSEENAAPSTGTLDVTAAPDGFMEITDQRTRSAAQAQAQAQAARYEPEAEAQRALASAVAAAVERAMAPLSAIEQRLARIEAQPMPGGPVFRSADKSTPLTPQGSAGAGTGAGEQIRALEALAGRIADPQAQVAVAAEMIRLQQEAAGLPAAMQVMPRAGRGWSDGK